MTFAEDSPRVPAKKLLAEMASDAAIAARGVVAICDSAAALGNRGPLGEQRVRLRISLVAEYGERLPEMAADVRGRVAAALEAETGCLVTAVDVTVADLYVPGEPSLASGPGGEIAAGARIDF
jgi:hypothetical protein